MKFGKLYDLTICFRDKFRYPVLLIVLGVTSVPKLGMSDVYNTKSNRYKLAFLMVDMFFFVYLVKRLIEYCLDLK